MDARLGPKCRKHIRAGTRVGTAMLWLATASGTSPLAVSCSDEFPNRRGQLRATLYALGAQEGQNCEYAAMIVGSRLKAKLCEEAAEMRLYSAIGDEQASGNGPIRPASAMSPSTSRSRSVSSSRGPFLARSVDQAGHDRGIDNALTFRNAPDGVGKDGDIGHPFLQ